MQTMKTTDWLTPINYLGKTMGEQTLEFELLTCINMLNKKNKKKK